MHDYGKDVEGSAIDQLAYDDKLRVLGVACVAAHEDGRWNGCTR